MAFLKKFKPRRAKKRVLAACFGMIFCFGGIIFAVNKLEKGMEKENGWKRRKNWTAAAEWQPRLSANEQSKCLCLAHPESAVDRELTDLCYPNPEDHSLVGQPFPCEIVKHLPDYMKSDALFRKLRGENSLTFVTAATNPKKLITLLESVRKFYPFQKVLVYDFYLGEHNRHQLRRNFLDMVNFRSVDLTKYPEHVTDLSNGAYKPVVITDALKANKRIVWLEPETTFVSGHLFSTLCHSRSKFSCPSEILVLKSGPFSTRRGRHVAQDHVVLNFNAIYLHLNDQLVANFLKWWLLCALTPLCWRGDNEILIPTLLENWLTVDEQFAVSAENVVSGQRHCGIWCMFLLSLATFCCLSVLVAVLFFILTANLRN